MWNNLLQVLCVIYIRNLGQITYSPKGALPASCAGVDVCRSPPLQAVRLHIAGCRQECNLPKQQSECSCAVGDMKSSPAWCLQPGRSAAGRRNWAQALHTLHK